MGKDIQSSRIRMRRQVRTGNPEEELSQPREIYVLGAGASYVHGAPLTDGLIPYAFTRSQRRNDKRLSILRDFLGKVFHFTVPRTSRESAWQRVPSLVDVLSVVDVALDRKESLARDFDFERLRLVRHALEFVIFNALEDSLRRRSHGQGGGRRSRATQELVESLCAERAAVISFNYDVIVDIALAMRKRKFDFKRADVEMLSQGDHRMIDYGVDFANVQPGTAVRRFQLLKLHGSFNWLRSRVTGNLYFGGMQKAAGILFHTPEQQRAANLHNVFGEVPETIDDLEPVLVTPTHIKDLRNSHLARIWRRAEECLRGAERITFIGYSLPGDDLHVKYLFKRAMETRPPGTPPPAIVVVDKGNPRTSQVRANYERFFGKDCVRYHGEGFDAWVKKHS
jgi:hypothetical protein